ncbi:hypothetical protein EKK58_08650 [Candidatus Dependentiae bacterium]|nr:MAG: hypothetical protein EKK58_08650 [Candidatus Dependentiae bacterium]
MSQSEWEKKRDEAAKLLADNFYPDSKQWRSEDGNFYEGAKQGADWCRTEMLESQKELVQALENWLTWEAEQVRKSGPYVGEKITKLISDGNNALSNYKKKAGLE